LLRDLCSASAKTNAGIRRPLFMTMLRLLTIAFAFLCCSAAEELRTASGHPMQYYLSLPQGWTATRKWPVVVVIESANRQFQETLGLFAKARKDMPFILVAPLVTTNGGANYRQASTYRYSDDVWRQIEQDRCGFDSTGIAAVTADVRKLFGGGGPVLSDRLGGRRAHGLVNRF
jgi:hypothetical protein